MVCGIDFFCFSLKWQFLIVVILVTSFFIFKNSPNDLKYVTDFFKNVDFIGHRGSPEKAPENTMISLELSLADGANAVEFDVALTKDNIPVLLHDNTLDRTTNLSGPIQNYLLSELSNCNCKAKFQGDKKLPPFVPISTLEQVFKWSINHKIKMILDIKDTNAAMIDAIDKLFRQYDIYELAIVSSFYVNFLYLLKRRNPKIIIAFAWCKWTYSHTDCAGTTPVYKNYFIQKLMEGVDKIHLICAQTWVPSFVGATVVLVHRSFVSQSYVQSQKASNRRVCAWTVNDENEMLWMRKVLNISVITDRPHYASIFN